MAMLCPSCKVDADKYSVQCPSCGLAFAAGADRPPRAPSAPRPETLIRWSFSALVVWLAFKAMSPSPPRPAPRPETRPAAPPTRPVAPRPPRMAPRAAFVGSLAPDFTLQDLNGATQSLHGLRRGRVAVLSFWLAGCGDCMPHVPGWAKLYQRYKEDDRLVLVNVAAFANDAAGIRRFCAENGIGGHVLLDGPNRAVPLYQLGTITALVIDRDGVVRYRGGQAEAHADRLGPALDLVLSESPQPSGPTRF